ncbi:MAG: hypothetical protein ACYC4H_09610 [Desulfocucumaceae bacterium]
MFEFILLVVLANLIILGVLYFIRHVIAIRAPVLFMAVGISIFFCILYPFLVAWLSYPRVIYLYGALILAGAGALYIIEMKFFTAEDADTNKSAGMAPGDVLAALEGGPAIDVGRGVFHGFGTVGKQILPDIKPEISHDAGKAEENSDNTLEELAAGIMPGTEPDEPPDSLNITQGPAPAEVEPPVSLLYEEFSGAEETLEESVPVSAENLMAIDAEEEVPACTVEEVSAEEVSGEYSTLADGFGWAQSPTGDVQLEPAAAGSGGEIITEEHGLLQSPAEAEDETLTGAEGLEPEAFSDVADLDLACDQEMTPEFSEAEHMDVPIPKEEEVASYPSGPSGQDAAPEYEEDLPLGVNTEISQFTEIRPLDNPLADISWVLDSEEGLAGNFSAVEQVVEEPVVEVAALPETVFYSEPLFSDEAEGGRPATESIPVGLGDISGLPVELEIRTIVARAFDALGAGDKFGAAECFFKALKLNPPPKLAAMVCVEISSIYLSEGRKAQALAVMEMLQEVWGPMLDENDTGRIKTIIIQLRREV